MEFIIKDKETLLAEEHEHDCAALARDAVEFIVSRCSSVQNVGFRGFTDLENEIYGWLYEHAIFDDSETS